MPHRYPAEVRRQVIEEAATKVFAERGDEAATTQEIAQAAGVVASVIYDYYRSKQELYVTLLERHGRALIGETIRVPADSNLRTELHHRIDNFLRAIEDNPFVWRLMFRDPPGNPEVGAAHARVQAGDRNGAGDRGVWRSVGRGPSGVRRDIRGRRDDQVKSGWPGSLVVGESDDRLSGAGRDRDCAPVGRTWAISRRHG